MTQTVKIIIPAAGWGRRMRPQTWSKPKPLISVAGRTALEHLLDTFDTVPADWTVEYVLIVSPKMGDEQLSGFLKEHYPDLRAHIVVQPEMRGQSDALYQARAHLKGPLIICFSDTLIETDFTFLAGEKAGCVAWVKEVPDPSRFGVAELNPDGRVRQLIEKPESLENKLAVVGCYYFQEGRDLVKAIKEQVRRGKTRKGEYFLTDTINLMLEHDLQMRTQVVDVWLDTGTIEATLETNRYLLTHGSANRTKNEGQGNTEIMAPVFIDPTAKVIHSVIGPYASIGPECVVSDCRVADSILEAGAVAEAVALKNSFIGRRARVRGRSADSPPLQLNIGDDSSVVLE
ncbi:MAG: NTP transferase domain-containing protein [Anaerolineales bacterium]|nr:NTP transferase domain-containing protein [Anaerolineales bacterium]